MTYTEEEIECYTNILKNLNDGLNIYTPILENIPLKKPEKVSCNNCGNTHFFQRSRLSFLQQMFSFYWSCLYERLYFQRALSLSEEKRLQEIISFPK